MLTSKHHDVDKGWAWVAAIALNLTMIVKYFTLYIGGVLYITMLETFNEGKAKTSLVSTINAGLLCFLAPVASIFINKFGSRTSIVTGGVLVSTGLACSAFINNLDAIIVSAGVLVGCGLALTGAGIVVNIGYYFQKRRNLMISIVFILPGIGMLISTPMGLVIVETYGLSSTFLIVAGIYAQTCVFGMLCKPSSLEREYHRQRKQFSSEKELGNFKSSYFNISLVRNTAFLCFLVSSFTWNFALVGVLIHLPNYLKINGRSDAEIGWTMTSFAIANIFGRFIGTVSISRQNIDTLFIHIGCLCLGGVVTGLFPLYSHNPVGQYAFTILLGMFCGCPNSMMTTLSIKFVGVSMISEAHGLSFFFSGIGMSGGPAVTGFLFGQTGSYFYSFILAGLVMVTGGILGIVASLLSKSGKHSDSDLENSTDRPECQSMLEINSVIEKHIYVSTENDNGQNEDLCSL